MNRIIIGQIQHDITNTGVASKVHRFWGDTHLRKGEFKSMPGCVEREHHWGFDLPLNTPQDVIERLSAPCYASSVEYAALWKKVANEERKNEYNAVYKNKMVTCLVWSDSIVIEAPGMILARIDYRVNLEARRDLITGDWELEDRYSRRVERFYDDRDDLTPAARREAWRVIGGLLAGFLEKHPVALIEGRNHALAQQRARISSEIVSLQAKIDEKRAELIAVPDDEGV